MSTNNRLHHSPAVVDDWHELATRENDGLAVRLVRSEVAGAADSKSIDAGSPLAPTILAPERSAA